MKKAIVLTKFIPAPAFSGGAIRSRAWIRLLSKYYDIIVIGYWDKKFGNTRVEELSDYAKEIFGFDFVRTKTSLFHKATTIWTSYNKDVILVSNRGEDSLVAFDVNKREYTILSNPRALIRGEGKCPRDFDINRGEKYAVAGFTESNSVTV